MKPKKKKAGNGITIAEIKQRLLAQEAFFWSVERAGMCRDLIPPKMILESICHLAEGKPLVFTHVGEDFIVCDPRTYAQMVGKP